MGTKKTALRIWRAAALAMGVVPLAVPGVLAQTANPVYEKMLTQDLGGAKDHPWTGRYGGASILLQTVAAFDSFTFAAGKAQSAGGRKFSRTVTAEGRLVRTVYVTPPGRSSLEVFRNFQNQLQSQGFTAEFQCTGAGECGEPFKELKYHWNNAATQVGGSELTADRRAFARAVFDGARDIRYGLYRRGSGPQTGYVSLYVALNQGGSYGDLSRALGGRVTALVEIVEPKAMENRIETVKSDAIAAALRSAGAVALYGLLFDTDQAVLKPQSQPQLAEMMAFLKNGNAKVFIVGHTDNQGSLDYNLSLSERRAKAVAAALTAQGVAASRLVARGVGPLSPTAANTDESGRAKNRRVELVLQ